MTTASPLTAFLPAHHFAERHAIRLRAGPQAAIEAAARLDPDGDPVIRRRLRLRELPVASAAATAVPNPSASPLSRCWSDATGIAYGLVGQYRRRGSCRARSSAWPGRGRLWPLTIDESIISFFD